MTSTLKLYLSTWNIGYFISYLLPLLCSVYPAIFFSSFLILCMFQHPNILSFFRLCSPFLSFPPSSSFFPSSASFFPTFSHHWLVCFLQDISYHCSSVCSTMPLCFLPRLSLCPRPFVLRPPGNAVCLSAFPRLMLLGGLRSFHSLSPVPREPAGLIKGKQTLSFPPALCKTLLIKE